MGLDAVQSPVSSLECTWGTCGLCMGPFSGMAENRKSWEDRQGKILVQESHDGDFLRESCSVGLFMKMWY